MPTYNTASSPPAQPRNNDLYAAARGTGSTTPKTTGLLWPKGK